jgi:threonine/homoserine/homoserine lactone efflux protein
MTLESLIAFNVVLIAAIASPGAALLYFVKTTVASGRGAGILTGLGLGVAASCWTLAALLGLDRLFVLFPWTYTGLKIGGAIYLIYLAVQTWRHATDALGDAGTPGARHFLSGIMINLGNPKSMLFAAAVIVVVFPKGLKFNEIALITANHLLIEITFYVLFATMLGGSKARAGYLRLKPLLDRIAGTVLGALGLRLLLER